jgi:hypothetical protein
MMSSRQIRSPILMSLIRCGHSTEDDRHNLLESLRSSSKPDSMKVQTYFYRIKELNDYVVQLPGHEEKLTKSQLNLAFYNRLPGSWWAKYMIARQSVHTDNRSELLRYFAYMSTSRASLMRKMKFCRQRHKQS